MLQTKISGYTTKALLEGTYTISADENGRIWISSHVYYKKEKTCMSRLWWKTTCKQVLASVWKQGFWCHLQMAFSTPMCLPLDGFCSVQCMLIFCFSKEKRQIRLLLKSLYHTPLTAFVLVCCGSILTADLDEAERGKFGYCHTWRSHVMCKQVFVIQLQKAHQRLMEAEN